jgi:hypothetical protein
MLAKRLFVIVVSLGIGFALTMATLWILSYVLLGGTPTPVTPASYGAIYFILTAIFLGAAVLVWLDAIFKTGMLPR